jgi:hypothetical protein
MDPIVTKETGTTPEHTTWFDRPSGFAVSSTKSLKLHESEISSPA